MELDTYPKSRGSPTFSMPKKHHNDEESDDSLDKDFMKIPKKAK